MLIKNINNSVLKYSVKMPRTLVVSKKKKKKIECTINCRVKSFYLHAGIKIPGSDEVVEVTVDDYRIPVYTLCLEKIQEDKVINSQEIIVALGYEKALQAWELLRKYGGKTPFEDIEAILEENGFPNPEDFDKYISWYVIKRVRQHKEIFTKLFYDDIKFLRVVENQIEKLQEFLGKNEAATSKDSD